MSIITAKTPPTSEPVTLSEAKLAARFDGDALDALIPGWITAARESAEHLTGRLFGGQTWRVELPAWPAATDVLEVHGATAVATSYWDGAAWTTPVVLATSCWAASGSGTVVAPPTGTSWPTPGARPVGPVVRIDITAGEAASEQVRLYICAVVAAWIANPEAAQPGVLVPNPQFKALLWRDTVY